MGVVLLSCSLALAGGQEAEMYKDKYYRLVTTPDSASYNPTRVGSAWTWPVTYTGPFPIGADLPLNGTVISSNRYLLLALENLYVSPSFVKELTVTINYTGAGPLLLQKASSGINGGTSVGTKLSETNSGGVYKLIYKIVPQPDWEWVLIKNTGVTSVTLTSVTINSSCREILVAERVPTLTHYGIGALILVLMGVALWLFRKKRLGVAA
jgi:hypothetical protein